MSEDAKEPLAVSMVKMREEAKEKGEDWNCKFYFLHERKEIETQGFDVLG